MTTYFRNSGASKQRILLAAILAGASGCASSSAFAQAANCTGGLVTVGGTTTNFQNLAIPAGAASATLAGTIANVNTAFLSQQGSAFVSAPPNPAPNQPGGGVWARGIGGEVDLRSTSISTGVPVLTGAGAPAASTTTVACNNNQHENFAGVQVGADIARLNWSGWNVHLGTTAGYLGAKSTDNNGFDNSIQVPFWGTYLVATKGRFFADVMVRQEFYNLNLNNQPSNFFNQPVGAHGWSISTSAGYNFDLGRGWFVEPSAGFIFSETSVDNFTSGGTVATPISGTISTNGITSEIGRASLRVGRTIEGSNVVWQPFGSVSILREFAGNVTSTYTNFANSAVLPIGGTNFPLSYTQTTSTSRVGTYGQYSLGLAGQLVNTGWLGFVRVDYRNGSNIDGWTGNAGIRYQFRPEMIASVMPVKVKAPPHPYVRPTNWTGFYVGGFVGAAAGRTEIGFVGADPTTSGLKPYVFGGLGGFEVGYNRQFSNNWVIGLEGDIGAANVHGGGAAGSSAGLNPLAPGGLFNGQVFSPALFTIQDKTNWMATATARVGYAYGRTLFYVKGGAAFEDNSLSAACVFGPTGISTFAGAPPACLNQATANGPAGPFAGIGGFSTGSTTRVGWTGGFGSEFDLGRNWSAKTEYDYLSFGRHNALASDGTTVLTDRSWISQVKIGLNYKFSPSLVTAKY